MGLAEPKRRSKIAHDPRNLAWKQQAASSFGQRMMVKQGWSEGESLGNRASTHIGLNDVDRLAAARVGVLFKDNNLGLGAKNKSQDLEAQRTGLDAYQAMLGRLNGKSEAEVEVMEKKVEDRKLAMYAKGRWGGMVFIKGGTLVGEKTFGTGETIEEQKPDSTPATTDSEEKNNAKEEKRKRKEARRLKREAKAAKRAAKAAKRQAKSRNTSSNETGSESESAEQTHSSHRSSRSHAPDEPVSSSSSGNEDATSSKKLKRKRSTASISSAKSATPTTVTPSRNGRHLLRGRNIQAKRLALTDMKGLDEIFMRPG
ncbi:hypothetical protein PV10_02232 [Exophiala mesophila]|uniref:G-patch domain-containing protein n=1 Tax=Exophiala mesophila TaxID=212818 RepID=A0A0D1WYD4_EXOME|nr:uncharacterized protein PV10_02232 [Exophiala mesophila]KIV94465.1 hypothetical protein PV10_02232 [Exophiala mesophila]